MQQRQVILYIAMSLDGFIAGENDSLDFLSQVEVEGEDYGYTDFVKTVDTVIMGRKTYEKVKSFGIPFPHLDRKVYVLSQSITEDNDDASFYNGDLEELIKTIRRYEGDHIFLDGGAAAITAFRNHHLIDRYIISIIPTIIGSGIRLFDVGAPPANLKLLRSLTFPSGLVQLWYDRISEKTRIEKMIS